MVIFVYLVQVVMIMGIIKDVDNDDVAGLMEKVTCKSRRSCKFRISMKCSTKLLEHCGKYIFTLFIF